ncbi:MAG: putative exported protein [Ramlibacter sp.]|jgi:tripartite-type tricarboxylate transporter receptor subunit TctC|nr:putative exported protein [Ramlibacter sp.]MDF2463225.1 putative exported protein [Ramlibacter sp.]
MQRKSFLRLLAASAASLALPPVNAQSDYPNRPIKVVVPFAPGGATDQVARLLAIRLAKQMNVPVIVENRAGANGNLGAELVARAAPDGYTILHNTSSIAFTAAFAQKVSYDLAADLTPVAALVNQPLLVVAGPSMPANTLNEMLAWARQNPGKLNYASSGNGNISHLVMYVLLQKAGISGAHVPYKGGAAAFPDVMSGQVHLLADPVNSAAPFVRDRRVRAIATTGRSRTPLFPDVQAVAEVMPEVVAGAWQGAMVPAKTPRPIVERLSAEYAKALQEPALRDKLHADGAEPLGFTPEQYAAFLKEEIDRWSKIVRSSGIKLD